MGIHERVRQFIGENFYVTDLEGPSPLDDEASLIDSGIVDSTGVLEVIAFLEDEYGISIEEREIVPDNFESIGRIVRFVERKRS